MRHKKHYMTLIIGILLPLITTALINAGYMNLPKSSAHTNSSPHASAFSFASDTPFQIVKVVDGDTIDLGVGSDAVRVRLIGINSPESVDPRRPVECFGKEASSHAKEILSGKTVHIELDPSQDMYDKYGRLLAYIILPDGALLNQKMVAEGYAYEYTYDRPYKYQKTFKAAQVNAREHLLGLWSSQTCSGKK